MSLAMNPITDPAVRLTDEFTQALADRYAGTVAPLRSASPDEHAERFSNVCDLVVQLLWPEKYRTGVEDPFRHTSDPARRIAALILEAAGVDTDPA